MRHLSNYTVYIVSDSYVYNERKEDMINVFSMISLIFIIIGFSIVISLIICRFSSKTKCVKKCDKSK